MQIVGSRQILRKFSIIGSLSVAVFTSASFQASAAPTMQLFLGGPTSAVQDDGTIFGLTALANFAGEPTGSRSIEIDGFPPISAGTWELIGSVAAPGSTSITEDPGTGKITITYSDTQSSASVQIQFRSLPGNVAPVTIAFTAFANAVPSTTESQAFTIIPLMPTMDVTVSGPTSATEDDGTIFSVSAISNLSGEPTGPRRIEIDGFPLISAGTWELVGNIAAPGSTSTTTDAGTGLITITYSDTETSASATVQFRSLPGNIDPVTIAFTAFANGVSSPTVLEVFTIIPSPDPIAPSFQSLGDLPGGFFGSTAGAISADGSTVVGTSPSSIGTNEAFIWTAANGIQGLGGFSGGAFFESRANGVSADGSVVVGSSQSSSGREPFIWDAPNDMQGLGTLPGGFFGGQAKGVSADGSVVVGQSDSGFGGGGVEAFIWNATDGMQGLGTVTGDGTSAAFGISANGSVVAGSSTAPGLGGQAMRWDSMSGMQGLGAPPGFFFAIATGISDDGSTILVWGLSSTGMNESAIWDATNGMQGLGDLPGGAFNSQPLDASEDGSVVVGFGTSAIGPEAFIWNSDYGMRRVETLLTSQGLDLTGWTLTIASGISADGNVIVGNGVSPSGQSEAWIATVPEPGFGAMLSLGVLGLLGLTERRKAAARTSSRKQPRNLL